MKTLKTEFICVKPRSKEAGERFDTKMDKFHSCRVDNRMDGRVYLSSISGRYKFIMSEGGDDNWEVV